MDFRSVTGDWNSAVVTLLAAMVVYSMLVSLLRVSGKRSIGKWNAFDLIVTVALGSTLATVILSRDVPILTGLTAMVALLALQYLISWVSVRSRSLQRLVRARPTLMVRDGRLLEQAMKKERVTDTDILAAVRQRGPGDLRDVAAVVLETDGSLTVLERCPTIPTTRSCATSIVWSDPPLRRRPGTRPFVCPEELFSTALPLVFDEDSQTFQRGGPAPGDPIERLSRLIQPLRFQFPDSFSSTTEVVNHTRAGQDIQVFGHSLAGDLRPSGECGDRQWTFRRKSLDQTQARRLSQCGKHRRVLVDEGLSATP